MCVRVGCVLTAPRLPSALHHPLTCRVTEAPPGAPLDSWQAVYISPSWVTPSQVDSGVPVPTRTPSADPSQYIVLGAPYNTNNPLFPVRAWRSTDAAWTWTDIYAGIASATTFVSSNIISMSGASDGSLVAAALTSGNTSQLLLSRDLGDSWQNSTVPYAGRSMTRVLVSSNGSVLFASPTTSANEYLRVSYDGAQTWANASEISRWGCIAMSDHGQYMVAAPAVLQGPIRLSSDYGQTWRDTSSLAAGPGSRSWTALTVSSDGQRVIGISAPSAHTLVLSSDSGASWTNLTVADSENSTARTWRDVACSSDGMRCAAVEVTGYLFMSTDGGATVSMPLRGRCTRLQRPHRPRAREVFFACSSATCAGS